MESLTPIDEGLEREFRSAEERDAAVRSLTKPWIAHEGPLDARFYRPDDLPELLPRGLAFDEETTVYWDEDEVQVVRRSEGDPDVVALKSPVLVRGGENGHPRIEASPRLHRVDYLKGGVLLGSRYMPADGGEPGGQGDA